MAKKSAYSYVRVSSKGQADGDGPERQRTTIAGFAKGRRYQLAEEFADLGVSGSTELAGRPGLLALLDAVGASEVDTVLVERADRLARDLIVNEMLVQKFREAGVRVLAADAGTDLTDNADPSRVLIRQVLGAVAQFNKSEIVGKLRVARQRIRAGGKKCEGRKSYGTHAAEADAIARMRTLRRKPVRGVRPSYQAVADKLNAEGFRTRRGTPFTRERVFAVLRA